jgi:ribulose 1,5-bisphosphate carboxylase large subunit-like protein
MRVEHIQRRHIGSSAALPAWAAGKFTDSQTAVMRTVGIEMLNKRGGGPPPQPTGENAGDVQALDRAWLAW